MTRIERSATAVALGRVSTVEAVVYELRRQILSGELGPGEHVREVETTETLGVGRHSLRAALQTLVHEGLLRHSPNQGHFVPRLTHQDVQDLFTLRGALECEAASLVATRGHVDPSAVQAVERLESLTGAEPWDEVIELDLRFHGAVVDSLRSPRMTKTFASLQGELQLLNAQLEGADPGRSGLGRQHRDILTALQSSDPNRAAAAVREHMRIGVLQFQQATSEG